MSRMSFSALKHLGTQGTNDLGLATSKYNGNLDVIVDHTGSAITDDAELIRSINLLISLQGWIVYSHKNLIERHHLAQGIENLAVICNHCGNLKSCANKRFQRSMTNNCKWRINLVKVVDKDFNSENFDVH